MKRDDVIFIMGLFCIALYVFGVLAMLNGLGQVNRYIKQEIYKHYNVELPKENK